MLIVHVVGWGREAADARCGALSGTSNNHQGGCLAHSIDKYRLSWLMSRGSSVGKWGITAGLFCFAGCMALVPLYFVKNGPNVREMINDRWLKPHSRCTPPLSAATG